jgi:hypothetical protein
MPSYRELIQRLSLVGEHRQEKSKTAQKEQHTAKDAGNIAEADAGDDETDGGKNEENSAGDLRGLLFHSLNQLEESEFHVEFVDFARDVRR